VSKITSVDTELYDTMANELSNGFGYVGDNNATRGIKLAKEALRRSNLKKGDRAMVWGIKDIAQRSDSTRGLIKTQEEAGMKVDFIQISQEVDKDPTLGAPVVTSYLATHPDVQMVLVDHT
jgi:simple sugar transport system substrate-binding protein